MVVKRASQIEFGEVLENELGRSYKRAEAHAGSGPKVTGRPRTVSLHDQIQIRPHQFPDHLIRALRRHADERPRQPAFVHLLNGQAGPARLTYARLDRRARARAAPPHPPPHRHRMPERSRAVAADAGARIALTNASGAARFQAMMEAEKSGQTATSSQPSVLPTDDIPHAF